MNWSFNGLPISGTLIEERGECKNLSGPFKVQMRPATLVVCNLDFTLHQGNYSCSTGVEGGASSTTALVIEGKCSKK